MRTKKETILDKHTDIKSLTKTVSAWRVKNDRIVFTNGCFDIIHKGHIDLLLQAAELGNRLIVGVNSDLSVKKLKGESRPINNEADRMLTLAAQLYVDAVILFDEDTPIELIKAIRPDVLVKGGDYDINNIIGADFVQGYGGEVKIVPLTENYSTSALIERLKK